MRRILEKHHAFDIKTDLVDVRCTRLFQRFQIKYIQPLLERNTHRDAIPGIPIGSGLERQRTDQVFIHLHHNATRIRFAVGVAQHHRCILVFLRRNQVVNAVAIETVFEIVESRAAEILVVVGKGSLCIGRYRRLDIAPNHKRSRSRFHDTQDGEFSVASRFAKVSIPAFRRNRIGKLALDNGSPAKIER